MGGTARPAWQLEQGSWSGVGVVLHTSLPGLCAAPGRAGSEPVRAVSRALPQASQAGSMSTSYHREDAALTRRILSLQGRRGSPCVCVCVCVCACRGRDINITSILSYNIQNLEPETICSRNKHNSL